MNNWTKRIIFNLILFFLHIAIMVVQSQKNKWDILEGFNTELIYKKAEDRGFIYLGHPELLDSIHGSTYNADDFAIDININSSSAGTNGNEP
jgi:hypothetical protein